MTIPVFEGCDLAGITDDIATARKACEVWKPVMAEHMAKKFQTRLMSLAPNPPIVFWCRDKISSIRDLKGKKVRVFNKTQADFVTAVGGETITMAFPEVVPALQRGVVDCALTGTLSGNLAGWPEVSKYLLPLTVGWSISYEGANIKSWNSWSPPLHDFFTKEFGKLENDMWKIGTQATDEGVNCNIGKGKCTLGKKGSMTLVKISDADKEAAQGAGAERGAAALGPALRQGLRGEMERHGRQGRRPADPARQAEIGHAARAPP